MPKTEVEQRSQAELNEVMQGYSGQYLENGVRDLFRRSDRNKRKISVESIKNLFSIAIRHFAQVMSYLNKDPQVNLTDLELYRSTMKNSRGQVYLEITARAIDTKNKNPTVFLCKTFEVNGTPSKTKTTVTRGKNKKSLRNF